MYVCLICYKTFDLLDVYLSHILQTDYSEHIQRDYFLEILLRSSIYLSYHVMMYISDTFTISFKNDFPLERFRNFASSLMWVFLKKTILRLPLP